MSLSKGAQNEPYPEAISEAELLRRERAQFALAERAANFGYWRVDLATQRAVWSPGMYRMLGITPSDRQPDSEWLLDTMIPEDRAKVEAAISAAIKSKSSFYYRTHSKESFGPMMIVDTHGEVEVDENGRVVAILGVCNDVTKEVVAETARVRAERRYRLMAEEASDAILLYAPGGRIVFTSSALERITGRNSHEIEEGKFLRLVHPSDVEEANKLRTRPAPNQTLTACYRLLHRDGHYVWLEVTIRGVYDEVTGEYLNTIGVVRDISERKAQELEMKQARDNAEHANRAKSAFLANMSHELRTPLNAIIGFTDIMQHQMFGPLGHPRYAEYSKLIHESGQLLLDLISDLLDMAKIEAGKLILNFEAVNLEDTIADCVRLVQGRALANNIDIKMSIESPGLNLQADRRALKQVLLNLLSNAVKFTMNGGHVTVSARETGSHVIIRVIDDGIGISKKDLPRLGRAFEQVVADPMLAKAGTGLGLALVSALVEEHNGSFRIDSEIGVGTEVTVELPIRQPERAAA
ncbi:MAG TPA: PAS domain-containing sensor histidine kinase [Rhizomicrobium sp.]|nr:PAS domain-containing sensor histidine kinase [Rhizomicrobium sp.]